MIIIAHRSGPVHFPEQTAAAAKESLNLGADYIEIDVRQSLDGCVVISHDPTAARLFAADKPIREMTAAEYTALRHKDAPDFTAHRFSDYLTAGIAPLLLHVKESEPDFLEKLVAEVKRFGYADKVIYGVQTVEALKCIKALQPDAATLAFMPKPEAAADFAAAGVDYIRLWEKWASPEAMALVRALGKKLAIMTGNYDEFPVGYTTKEKLAFFVGEKADAILINDVRELTRK